MTSPNLDTMIVTKRVIGLVPDVDGIVTIAYESGLIYEIESGPINGIKITQGGVQLDPSLDDDAYIFWIRAPRGSTLRINHLVPGTPARQRVDCLGIEVDALFDSRLVACSYELDESVVVGEGEPTVWTTRAVVWTAAP
jgi:hypothetical protein